MLIHKGTTGFNLDFTAFLIPYILFIPCLGQLLPSVYGIWPCLLTLRPQDFLMDWSLFQRDSPYPLLRKELVYHVPVRPDRLSFFFPDFFIPSFTTSRSYADLLGSLIKA